MGSVDKFTSRLEKEVLEAFSERLSVSFDVFDGNCERGLVGSASMGRTVNSDSLIPSGSLSRCFCLLVGHSCRRGVSSSGSGRWTVGAAWLLSVLSLTAMSEEWAGRHRWIFVSGRESFCLLLTTTQQQHSTAAPLNLDSFFNNGVVARKLIKILSKKGLQCLLF